MTKRLAALFIFLFLLFFISSLGAKQSSAGCFGCATAGCGACSTTVAGWRCQCTGTDPQDGGYLTCQGVQDASCTGCVPSCSGKICGQDNGCGQPCLAGSGCCTPITSCPAGKNCGSISDSCGGTLNCGTCTSPAICCGGGTPNACGAPNYTVTGTISNNPSPVTACASGYGCSNSVNTGGGTYTISGLPPDASSQITVTYLNGYRSSPALGSASLRCGGATTVAGPNFTYAPAPAYPASACAAASGAVAIWHLDETSGSTAADSSGNNNTATAVGTTIVPGFFNNARNFSAGSDKITTATLVSMTSYTYEAWVKFARSKAFLGSDIIFAQSGSNPSISRTLSDGKIRVRANGSEQIASTRTVRDTDWHHYAITADGANLKLYINGVLEGSQAFNAASTQGPLYFGEDPGGTNTFSGIIDEVRVYNRALSATEIADEATAGPCCSAIKINCSAFSPCVGACGNASRSRTCTDSSCNVILTEVDTSCVPPGATAIISGQIMNAPQAVSVCAGPGNTCSPADTASYSIIVPANASYTLNAQTIFGHTVSPQDYPVTVSCTSTTGPTFWYDSDAGVVGSGSTIDSGLGKISQGGVDPGYQYNQNTVPATKINYANLLAAAQKSRWTPVNNPANDLSNVSGNQYALFPAGAQTITGFSFGNRNRVVFVNGDLAVTGNIIDDGGSTVFIINGNLSVAPSVSELDGVYVVSGSFDDSLSPSVLRGYGSLLVLGSAGLGFNRAAPITTPAEDWHYQAKYLILFPDVLASPRFTWNELPPQ